MNIYYRTTNNNNNDNVEEEDELENLSLAADGLIRLRDHPEDDERSKESIRFAQESLHSYRFSSSTSTTTRTDLAELRKSLMNRSIDFMKHKNTTSSSFKTTPDTVPARFHSSSLFHYYNDIKNQHHHHQQNHHLHLHHQHNNDLLFATSRTKTKSVGYDSPVTFFNVEQYRASRRRRQSNPIPDIQEGPKSSRPVSPVTPDDVDLVTEQLKHMHNNHGSHDSRASTNTIHLSSSSSSYSSCTTSTTCSDDNNNNNISSSSSLSQQQQEQQRPDVQRHTSSSTTIFPHPALHNTSRFLPQNQAILTTYDDWRVILSNDIAALVLVGIGGSSRGLVGKSVVDFIEPSYRDRFLDMVTKRREELSHLEDSMGGMVLICGNVVCARAL